MLITKSLPKSQYVELCVDLDMTNPLYSEAKTHIILNKKELDVYIHYKIWSQLEDRIKSSLKVAVICYYIQSCLFEKAVASTLCNIRLTSKKGFYQINEDNKIILEVLQCIETINVNDITICALPNEVGIPAEILEELCIEKYKEKDLPQPDASLFTPLDIDDCLTAQDDALELLKKDLAMVTSTPSSTISYDDILVTTPNPVTTFNTHIPRIGKSLAYCIQGAEAVNETQYIKFVSGIFNMINVTELSQLVQSIPQCMKYFPNLKARFMELKNMNVTLTPRGFCSAVGSYEHESAIERFLSVYPNIDFQELLKYYLVADTYPKIISYNVTNESWQYPFYLLSVLMGNTVLIINPKNTLEWDFLKYINNEYEYPNVTDVSTILDNAHLIDTPIVTSTSTYTIMEQVKSESNSVIDNAGQKTTINFVRGTFEDIQTYWDLPYALREGFQNTGVFLSVPILFVSLKGIINDKSFIKDMNKIFSTAEIIYETNVERGLVTQYLIDVAKTYLKDDSLINFKKVMSKHSYLSDETLMVLKNALDTILKLDVMKCKVDGKPLLKQVMPLFASLVSMDDEVLTYIQENNSFSGKPKQVIYYPQNSKKPMSYDTACTLTLYAFIGCLDVLIWSPYKYKTIDDHINTEYLQTINLPDVDLDFKYKYKKSFLNTLFK